MIIADLKKIEGRTYPAQRRTQNVVGGVSPVQATNFAMGYVTLEPNGGQVPWHNQEQEEVYFLIDSPGGVISACVTLITAMRACKGKIIGIVNGMAASCGAIFISNVDELRMGKHAQIMFHGSSSGFIGNTQQGMEDSAAIIEYVKDLCRPALEKGILLEDEFENAFDKKCDVYLTYEQLKERGVLS